MKLSKKMLDALRMIARQILEQNIYEAEELLGGLFPLDPEFEVLDGEFPNIAEGYALLKDEETDMIKALFASIILNNTDLDKDEVYSYLFGGGKRIYWC